MKGASGFKQLKHVIENWFQIVKNFQNSNRVDATPGDAPGDVLVFPQMRRHRLGGHLGGGGGGGGGAVTDFVRECIVEGDGGVEGEALTGAHVFICTHGRGVVCVPRVVQT